MRKLFKSICIVALLIFSLTIIVSAHSGKTDANGGHYDHSTGGYHYHHGRSAHSHYDIDGDGTIDCPYDVKVKNDSSKTDSNKMDFGDIVLIFILIGGVVCVGIYIWKK